jgi:CubicO group peptidase (beta-lactamase class C family)
MQVACALALAACSSGAPLPGVTQTSAQPQHDRRELSRSLQDTIAALLAAAHADSAFPGAYAIVGDSRGILLSAGVGRLDWTDSPRPGPSTLWDLASLTKVIATTTVAAQLVDRGVLDLDRAVQAYLPEWVGPGKERVTTRHLLTHTSGLPAFRPYDQQTQNPDSLAGLLFATELERAPGERMVYSDIGAFVLGRVVERVGGARLDALAERGVFRPLAMQRTMFRPPRGMRPHVAPTEIDTLRGGLVHGVVHDERAYYLGGVAAHAGLFGSAADLARFAMMMLQGGQLGQARILDSTTIARFTAYAEPSSSNRALGWQKPDREGIRDQFPSASWAGSRMTPAAFGHTGFTGTSIAIDPQLDVFIVLLSNRVNPTRDNPRISAVRRAVADAVVGVMLDHRATLNDEPR